MADSRRSALAVAAAVLLNTLFGSLYAFSVFLAPLEDSLAASRGAVSLVFSLATVSFTISMLLAGQIHRLARPARLAALSCFLAAAGLGLAALVESLVAIWVGYGILFGAATGIGYAVALQAANSAWPNNHGLATGLVVAAFGLGALLFSQVYGLGIDYIGAHGTFAAMACLLAAAGVVVAVLLARSEVVLADRTPETDDAGPSDGRAFPLMWIGWALGAAAGLMTVAHASGIVASQGGFRGEQVLAVTLIAAGNAFGRLAAGWLIDHLPVRYVLMSAALVGAVSLFAVALFPSPGVALLGLALVGLSQGSLAGAYPAAIGAIYGPQRVGAVFGRLFTAWGVAGLLAPWLAGVLFDTTGGYELAVLLAGGAMLLSCLTSTFLATNKKPSPA